MEKAFNTFMSQLQKTNQQLDFFCDFEKIENNVNEIKLSLCVLNSLIGTSNLRESVETIWNRDPKAFEVLPILIAVRNGHSKIVLDTKGQPTLLSSFYRNVDSILEYLESTGLAYILQNKKINDLVDYVFGIETGLDTNARKNRSGKLMENIVGKLMSSHGIPFRKEVCSNEWSEIKAVLGKDEKRFDFVIYTPTTIYLTEVNFYSGGGSKLNEVARSYSEIAPKINSINGFEFVWITDGIGWISARNKLQEAYQIIPHVYNLTNINEFINLVKGQMNINFRQ